MNNNQNDMALDALLAATREAAPDLSIDLLKAIYQIEKTNRFDQDRDVQPSIQKLIDDEILTNSWGKQ